MVFTRRYLFLFVGFLFVVSSGSAEDFPLRGSKLIETRLVRGDFWGETPEKTAQELGLTLGPVRKGLNPHWYVGEALTGIWEADPFSGFEHIAVSTGAWLLLRKGVVMGYVAQNPLVSWTEYEVAVRKWFGPPEKIHFTLQPSQGVKTITRYMHIYLWENRRTQFLFVKGTVEDNQESWQLNSDTVAYLRILQRVGDERVPLFVGAFDSELLHRTRGHIESPAYLVPLTPLESSVK